ncbi:MAG: CHAT domain-containing protein [Vicinamibacterales bacterium]
MARITLHSSDWSLVEPTATRSGPDATTSHVPDDLPDTFLADGAETEAFVARPSPATRGAVGSGPVDFSYAVKPGQTAAVVVRHPSGALTFHAPRAASRTSRGGPTDLRFTIPVRPGEATPATRGLVGKALKFIVVKVAEAAGDKLATLALSALAKTCEELAWRRKGLTPGWLGVTADALKASALKARRPTSEKRSLLLLHGTFSNAAAAFRGLADSGFFDEVRALYDDRIFAFDHFTLSRTPDENAKELVDGLPETPVTFDVITHSRGGLVLRSLVERADGLGPKARNFHLGRAVLVASPNEGTPLATPQRWQDTVGWLANLIELFPDNPFTTGAEFVANGIVWIARHASGDLPGLRAMDGDGAFIEALQGDVPTPGTPKPPRGQYAALVANFNPHGQVLERLIDTGIDQFFGAANDLVVPTEGGWRIDRSGASAIVGSQIGCFGPGGNLPGDAVTHVNIFLQKDTPTFLARVLKGDPLQLPLVDPAKALPDRRLLRSGAQGLAAPVVASGAPRAGLRARLGPTPTAREHPLEVPALRVTILNGDLTFERRPLMLGHYRSSRLTGSEAVVDRLVGGAMSRSLEVGMYPVEPGTHHVFFNTSANGLPSAPPRPEAVIVVGLGQEGGLQAKHLVYTVRQAALAWVQRDAERRALVRTRSREEPLELAATLIGSGGSSMSSGQSAQLIAQGVAEANHLVAEVNERARQGDARPRAPRRSAVRWRVIGHLTLIELYLDRATEAWSALKLQAAASDSAYRVTDEVCIGTGPLPRTLDSGYRGANYDFISAQTSTDANKEPTIAYALSTRRARTEVRAQATQGRLVRQLVASASGDAATDDQIGRTLYQLLVPLELESFLSSSGDVQLELDQGTAGIPWELLTDAAGSGQLPWAIRTKLLRKLRTQTFRERVIDADSDGYALVVGEPQCPPEYPRLPGAFNEAKAVFACLSRATSLGGRAELLAADGPSSVGPDARSVVNKVFERTWRMVHIAGHGAPPSGSEMGGVVLSNGTFLGPLELGNLRVVPELVFVNCCHLGAASAPVLSSALTRPGTFDRAAFASSVAEQLITIGVRCVVAAGWAVDDGAATTFATTFYESLVERKNRFIDAVGEAREAAYRFAGHTWAAYQCYGDPDWRFDRLDKSSNRRAHSEKEFDGVASVADLKLALETLFVQTKFQGARPDEQRTRIERLELRWQQKAWPVSDDVGELFARAYAEAGDLDRAIDWYGRAAASADGNVSLKALEQQQNLRVRRAWQRVEKAQRDRQGAADDRPGGPARRRRSTLVRTRAREAQAIIEEAIEMFGRLESFGETAERANLRASAFKRLAMVEGILGRESRARAAIVEMQTHYERALERASGPSDRFYSAMNCVAAEIALHAWEPRWKGVDRAVVETARASLASLNRTPDFWSVVGGIELDVYDALARHRLARARPALERAYAELRGRVAGKGWGSVHDTANFVLTRYTVKATKAERLAAESLCSLLAGYVHEPATTDAPTPLTGRRPRPARAARE